MPTKKLPKIISQEEFEKLFDYVTDGYHKTENKNRKENLNQYRIAILLGFEAGMRISEVVGFELKGKKVISPLTKDKIEGNSIRISGKGGKDRIVPRPKRLNQNAVNILPLSVGRRAIQKYITNLGKKVLHKDISFHTLRHGFVTHLVNSGRPLHEVQMLAGHSRLDTTGIYLHANPKKAIEGARDVF